ncbi:MAG: hypothetical protein LBC29_07465, partial [Propionibacteriaceae bacterium]|nr:hypothetical protein [Propionibacteriaceae bacterium]
GLSYCCLLVLLYCLRFAAALLCRDELSNAGLVPAPGVSLMVLVVWVCLRCRYWRMVVECFSVHVSGCCDCGLASSAQHDVEGGAQHDG